MMKLKIFEGNAEKQRYLKLAEDVYGVKLQVCDKEGKVDASGTILRITKDGYLTLFCSVGHYDNTDYGLKLDIHRKIIIKE